MKFWTRTTWMLIAGAVVAGIITAITREVSAGWLCLLLAGASVACSYLAISEQEADETRISQDECDALAQWADARQQQMRRREVVSRARDRAERRRAERGL